MISVIIPLYNKAASIRATLRSVLSQDYGDFEVVVADDGSTDGGADIVRGVADKRLRLVSRPNGGPSAARNTGVAHARGEWVLPIDADDEMTPGALSRFAEAARKYPDTDMFQAQVLVSDGSNSHVPATFGEGCVRNMFAAQVLRLVVQLPGTVMCRRSVYERFPYNEAVRRYEDAEWLMRVYRKARVRLVPYVTAVHNVQYSAASTPRRDAREDFVGHIALGGKPYWEQLALYRLFLWEHASYEPQLRQLRPGLYRRPDLRLTLRVIDRLASREPLRCLLLRALGLTPFLGRRQT